MSRTIQDVLRELRESALDTRDQGDRFERLMKSYLLTDPEWSAQFSNVWLWSEWPGRGGRPDTGIDLVAQDVDGGGLTAIQCKFYLPDHQVSKGDVDSFLATSGKVGFTRRLIISTTDKWGKNAEDALHGQTVPTQRIGMGNLAESRINWDQFTWTKPEKLPVAAAKTPREHQRTAIDEVKSKLAGQDRGQLIMACGTGKTFTSLRLAEEIVGAGGRVLFLVPSIQLLSQSLREWSQETIVGIRPFAVCSDVRVGRKPAADDGDISVVDLTEPATTDPAKLNQRAGAASKDRMTVVFSTYQSIDVISQAQTLGLPEFDLIICDEAHRTTGVKLADGDESHFVKVHDQSFLAGRKRVYMTATPKVFGDAVKQRAADADAVLTSMDNEDLFGPVLHRLGFGEAVERDLLTDYKVLVLAIDETYVASTFQNAMAHSGEIQLGDAAKLLGCWNGLAKNYQRESESSDAPTTSAGTEVEDVTIPVNDRVPMRRAVAFAKNIRASQQAAASFPVLVERAIETHPTLDRPRVEAAHVDGTMSILARNELLRWLKDETIPDDVCRILSNARCLSEGVDVPALDAVMFLTPRGSQVDVVQSVGRVMRRAPGKDLGYIILPVVVPNGVPAEKALDDNERYKVVWQVLQALRSHDDRFHTMINQIDLNGRPDGHLIIDTVTPPPGDTETPDSTGTGSSDEGAIAVELPFDLDAYRDAMYARIVKKVGERDYLEKWTKNIADIVEQHTVRLRGLVDNPATPEIAAQFDEFVAALRANLNDSITADEAVNMLSQHLVTKPVFEALFDGYHFTDHNPVGQVMQTMLDALDGRQLEAETQDLEGFYDSVRRRVSGIDNAAGKQTVITELYEKFFKLAFPKVADALGIIYTPIPVVDFILRGVNDLLRSEFGTTISAPGVHVLDPFTGTGTFIVRLLSSGLIEPADLARKYTSELHANEVLLLAYYIAAANIEVTYRDLARQHQTKPAVPEGDAGWEPFDGIVLADTFQMTEADDTLDGRVFANNSQRAERQLDLDIRVILGNPPYSVGQTSGNDNNANLGYPTLDGRIEKTYAARSTATNKNSLYDSYIRAIRWASDRLGESGIVGFVTNGGFINSNTTDGLRKTLADEFTSIYVYNLRGNQRTAGELSRREGGKVFDAGSRATVAITFLIKNPAVTGQRAVVRYHDIGDYLTRPQKLELVDHASVATLPWQHIIPNDAGDWINQRGNDFATYSPLGEKNSTSGVVTSFGRGLASGRDAWVYNFSRDTLQQNVDRMITFYNSQVDAFARHVAEHGITDPAKHVKALIDTDPGRFSWNRADRTQIVRGRKYQRRPGSDRVGSYRPFTREHVWFDPELNDMVYRLPAMFPTAEHPNHGFVLTDAGSHFEFCLLATDLLPNLHLLDTGKFFPRYTYEVVDDSTHDSGLDYGDAIVDGYRRVDNVTDRTLARYRSWYGAGATKDEIFAFIYGFLHSPDYRGLFAHDLARSLPRIPRIEAGDWPAFRDAGRALMDLHIGYETVEPYPLTITGDQPMGTRADDLYEWFVVEKMRWAGNARAADKSRIIYNPRITVAGIPDQAHQYMLGSRSAIEWIIDRYRVTADKPSGIVNNPNDYSREIGDPRYILDLLARIVTVSVRTVQVVDSLPPLRIVAA
ncbi:MAG: DEAD/DEAH box helicase [Nakamurella sp.]